MLFIVCVVLLVCWSFSVKLATVGMLHNDMFATEDDMVDVEDDMVDVEDDIEYDMVGNIAGIGSIVD